MSNRLLLLRILPSDRGRWRWHPRHKVTHRLSPTCISVYGLSIHMCTHGIVVIMVLHGKRPLEVPHLHLARVQIVMTVKASTHCSSIVLLRDTVADWNAVRRGILNPAILFWPTLLSAIGRSIVDLLDWMRGRNGFVFCSGVLDS
jgi:hypothetical protein